MPSDRRWKGICPGARLFTFEPYAVLEWIWEIPGSDVVVVENLVTLTEALIPSRCQVGRSTVSDPLPHVAVELQQGAARLRICTNEG